MKNTPPVHPSALLRELYMPDYSLDAKSLAKLLHVVSAKIDMLIQEKSILTPDIAVRLSRLFDRTVEFWLNLQHNYDLRVAKQLLEGDSSGIKLLAV